MSERPRHRWGDPSYKPRTCKFLNESLLEFPDPKSLPQPNETTSKAKTIVDCLTARHKEQRNRLLQRHLSEYSVWRSDTDAQIDPDTPYPINPKLETDLPESALKLLESVEAKKALDELPTAKRTVLMCTEQLKEADEKKNCMPSHAELAAEIGRQEVRLRARMVKEEQELHMFQLEARQIYYESMNREAESEKKRQGQFATGGFKGAPISPSISQFYRR